MAGLAPPRMAGPGGGGAVRARARGGDRAGAGVAGEPSTSWSRAAGVGEGAGPRSRGLLWFLLMCTASLLWGGGAVLGGRARGRSELQARREPESRLVSLPDPAVAPASVANSGRPPAAKGEDGGPESQAYVQRMRAYFAGKRRDHPAYYAV